MNNLVYVVEDDFSISDIISICLKSEKYEVKCFDNALKMLQEVEKDMPILILMDIMMPKMNGFSALSKLKKNHKLEDIPVILISAKSLESDIVYGLELGASDYITKPFGLLELRSRIKANIRKSQNYFEDVINFKDLKIDLSKMLVTKSGEVIDLTQKEFDLLVYLIKNKNHIVTRKKLLEHVWKEDFEDETRKVDMQVKALRKKINCDSKVPTYIKTIRSVGYMAFD